MTATSGSEQSRRILVTGSTGAVGAPVVRRLVEAGHHVRGFARRPTPGLEDSVEGDLADRDKVRAAVKGMEVVIHLGAYPDNADFLDVLLEPNVKGLFHICEACREFGIQRLVLASTLQVVGGGWKKNAPIRVADGVNPRNHYALTKVWGEEMGAMVARCHAISVVNARVGWLPRSTRGAARIAEVGGENVYLSHADAARFFERCVLSDRPGPGECATVFVVSRPKTGEVLELAPAREWLGYEPEDVFPQGLDFPYP
ncbi:MAG: NAD(P)-dependent oxidoreductase [Puniceicoccaceae bacterium]|nr:MAG: NAD(P)-dependent oxidoreductase [Puniceicoccaceae bacterium]